MAGLAMFALLVTAAAPPAAAGTKAYGVSATGGVAAVDTPFGAQVGAVMVATLTADAEANPLGVDVARPRLAWVLRSEERNESQSAYQVIVGTSPGELAEGRGEVWDSGKVGSTESTGIAYGGPPLRSATRYYWRVRVWDREGRPSPWSRTAMFESGLLHESDWAGARWIGRDNPAADPVENMHWNYPARLEPGHTLGQTFTVNGLFNGVCGIFPNWVTTGSGMTLTLRTAGPSGTVVTSKQFPDVPNNSTQCLTFSSHPAGTYYLEMSDPVNVVGWWSHSDDLLAGGQAYADGQPVNGDRALQVQVPTAAAPLLRRDFDVSKEVVQARVHVSGLGYYVLSIDGKRIGNSVLDPGFTVYDKTALYATYDVTSAVRERGAHALGVSLGRGFYGLPPGDTKYWGGARWWGDPRVRLKLDVEYADGSHDTVVSNAGWQTHDSPTTRDSIYMGENYDARLAQPGWDRPHYDAQAKGWQPAAEDTVPMPALRSQRMEPIRVVDTLRADNISSPSPGTYVFKFPVVTAGWARLQVKGPAGTEVTLRYGEKLRADGTVNNDGDPGLTNGPIQTDRYVLRGGDIETWEPSFSYKGFQYVQVDGYPGVPTADDVVARVVHSDVPSTGTFDSSDGLLNTVHQMTRRTILNNLHSILEDSPMFEKRGWLDDASLLAPTTIDNFGMRRFYRNWLTSVRDNQGPDGAGVELSPNPYPAGYTDPIWAGALVLVPWYLYQEYGDQDVLAANYDAMARYVDYLATQAHGFIQPGFYGDWASPNPIPQHVTEAFAPPEGPALTATAYFYRHTVVMSQVAGVLGHAADATRFSTLAQQIKNAFNAKFLDLNTGVYHTDKDVGYRQSSNAVPLMFDLVPADLVDKVAQHLKDDVMARGNHLNSGSAGTKELLPALTEQGYIDTAFAVATQRTYPSWGFWITNGATTTWERWETATRSRDHAFEGSIDDWFFRDLAGIKPAAPGYAQIAIRPYVPANLDRAAASVDTVRGTVASRWQKSRDGSLTLDVTVPVNATAAVAVPASSPQAVTEGSGPAAKAKGVRFVRMDGDRAVFEVGSGTYSFRTS